jgi:hypothetical protein
MFHGHGASEEEHKNNLLRYFRQVNKGLQEYIKKLAIAFSFSRCRLPFTHLQTS